MTNDEYEQRVSRNKLLKKIMIAAGIMMCVNTCNEARSLQNENSKNDNVLKNAIELKK